MYQYLRVSRRWPTWDQNSIFLLEVHPIPVEKLIILFYLGLATATCGPVGLFVFGRPSVPGARDWVLAVVIGLLGMVQQYILVWAVQVSHNI